MRESPRQFRFTISQLFVKTFWAAVFCFGLVLLKPLWGLPGALIVSLTGTLILAAATSRMKPLQLMWIAAVVAAAVLLVTGGIGFYLASRQKAAIARFESMNTDPLWIIQRAEAVAVLDAPGSFLPAYSINVLGALVQYPVEFWALYRDGNEPNSILVLAYEPNVGPDLVAKLHALQVSIDQVGQHYPRFTKSTLVGTESLALANGSTGTFQFQKGTIEPSGVEYWEVAGLFPGRRYPAMLVLIVPVSGFDEARLRSIIQSINPQTAAPGE